MDTFIVDDIIVIYINVFDPENHNIKVTTDGTGFNEFVLYRV